MRSGLARVGDAAFSVRGKATALTTVTVAVVLVVAAFALVSLQRRTLTDNIETTVRLRAVDITTQLSRGEPPESFVTSDAEVAFVQVVDGEGRVVASSANVAGLAPVVELRPPEVGSSMTARVTGIPVDDEPFHVLARAVERQDGLYTVYVGGNLEEVEESTDALIALLRVGIPLLLVGVAVGTWVLVGRALAPVESIRAEVAEMGGRELGRRVPEPRARDEIGRLARTMNDMLARLDESRERQQRFVADASHELRSPLASMRAQIEVDRSHPETASWETTASELHEEIVRMQRLVDELLFLARSDKDRVEEWRPVDVDDIVLEEARRLRGTATVAIETSEVSAGQVRGDADQLRRVVRNLLENAVAHARNSVVARLSEDGTRTTLVIEDDGPGVPAEVRERIFERFVRLDSARTPGRGGIGLGLAITRAIVEAHGGRVEVDGSYEGGARFVVTMPSADSLGGPAVPERQPAHGRVEGLQGG